MGAVEAADVSEDLDLAEDVIAPIGGLVSRSVLRGDGGEEPEVRRSEVVAGARRGRGQVTNQFR